MSARKTKPTPPSTADLGQVLTVDCVFCRVRAGALCIDLRTKEDRSTPHLARYLSAKIDPPKDAA